jgi:hypothetical protein
MAGARVDQHIIAHTRDKPIRRINKMTLKQ